VVLAQQIEGGRCLPRVSTFPEWFSGRRLWLLRFASTLCHDEQTAQDLVQDVTIRAYSRWDQLQAMDHPDAYLRRMVINEFLSWKRKWGRISPVGILTDRHVNPSGDHAVLVADQQQLRAELARLPPRQRAVLVLRYYEGLDDAAIADLLGTRPVTIRAYASRALARLRIELADESPPVAPPQPAPAPPTSTLETHHAH